ncbi:MAG: alpha/beta hydrolase [Candidatus Woesearchaeota archaeon]
MRNILIRIRDILIVSLFIYIVLGIFAYTTQDSLILIGDDEDFYGCENLPEAAVPTEHQGERFFYANNSDDALVILYHGNAASGCAFDDLAYILEDAGVSYILSVYPGFAGDEDKQSIHSMLEYTESIDSFIDIADYDMNNTMIIGYSIGGTTTSYHASRRDFRKIFLISAFNRLSETVSGFFPFYPVSLMLKEDLKNDMWLKGYDGEISVAYAEDDLTVNSRHTEHLIENLKYYGKEPETYIINDSDHNRIMREKQLLAILYEEAISLRNDEKLYSPFSS